MHTNTPTWHTPTWHTHTHTHTQLTSWYNFIIRLRRSRMCPQVILVCTEVSKGTTATKKIAPNLESGIVGVYQMNVIHNELPWQHGKATAIRTGEQKRTRDWEHHFVVYTVQHLACIVLQLSWTQCKMEALSVDELLSVFKTTIAFINYNCTYITTTVPLYTTIILYSSQWIIVL